MLECVLETKITPVSIITSLASVFDIIRGLALPVVFENEIGKADSDQAKIKVWNAILSKLL